MSENDKLKEVIESIDDESKAKDLKKDAENVMAMLKAAKAITEEVFSDAPFNDVITIYTVLKSEKITRIAEEKYAKSGGQRTLPAGVELVPLGQLGPLLGGGNGNNGGLS